MPSLTPSNRSLETTEAAFNGGMLSGLLTFIPSTTAVYAAMQNAAFRKSTNWQSRTALVIMPPLFVFALASEQTLSHRMKEMASESDHSKNVNEWALKNQSPEEDQTSGGSIQRKVSSGVTEKHLHALYRKSVEESGVRIIPGHSLSIHHKIANFWQDNPFKMLGAFSVPTILYIFRGRSEKKHLQFQSKLMHTRVFGQFAVLSMLLTFMGFKTYMDSFGRFITQTEADLRVQDMTRMRQDLLKRIEFDKKTQAHREKMLGQSKK